MGYMLGSSCSKHLLSNVSYWFRVKQFIGRADINKLIDMLVPNTRYQNNQDISTVSDDVNQFIGKLTLSCGHTFENAVHFPKFPTSQQACLIGYAALRFLK